MRGRFQDGSRSDIVVTVYTVHTHQSSCLYDRSKEIVPAQCLRRFFARGSQARSGSGPEAGDRVDLEEAEFVPAAILELLLAGLG